jgi:hypothetical protein
MLAGLTAAAALAAFALPAFAQEATEAAAAAPEFASAAETAFIFNTLLFLMGGFLVMWMAAGFAMLEAGMVRSKNVSMQCLKNIALYSIAGHHVLGYRLFADVHQTSMADISARRCPIAGPRRVPPMKATIRWPPTGSSRWCSAPPQPRSFRVRLPNASRSGRS